MDRKRAGRGAAFVLVAGMLVLAACGDGDPTVSEVGQPPPTDAPGTTRAPTTAAQGTTTTAAGALVRTVNTTRFGVILTDNTGRTLYTFDRDTPPTSTCLGGCATTWPPLLVPGAGPPTGSGLTGTLSSALRPEGTGSQVTYNGKPLYRYAADANPGDVTGDGVGGVWHVAKP